MFQINIKSPVCLVWRHHHVNRNINSVAASSQQKKTWMHFPKQANAQSDTRTLQVANNTGQQPLLDCLLFLLNRIKNSFRTHAEGTCLELLVVTAQWSDRKNTWQIHSGQPEKSQEAPLKWKSRYSLLSVWKRSKKISLTYSDVDSFCFINPCLCFVRFDLNQHSH